MGRFQVLFSGDVAEGATETAVRQNLMRRLGLDERKVAQLFSGRTVVIRSDLTREAADELQGELAGLGAIARIKDISPDEKAKFKIDKHVDQTLKDITAAHHECPRCGHLQLESEFCARCGVDIAAAAKQKRKEDLLIEKKIKGLKDGQKPGSFGDSDPVVPDVADRIEPIKRRTPRPVPSQQRVRPAIAPRPATAPRAASMRPQARSEPAVAPREARREPVRREPPRREPPAPASPSANPFGGGFWRNVLKLGRKDERSQ
jgi:ribosomal protein S27AE